MEIAFLEQAYTLVREALPHSRPVCGLILGSGLGRITDNFSIKGEIPYEAFVKTNNPTMQGHLGRMIWGELAGLSTLVFSGRRHWYEGLGWEPIAIPVYLLKKLGASTLVLTNAAGAIREDLQPGDLMVIDDHINAMGTNPLIGAHNAVWGSRFPDQSCVYDVHLRGLWDDAAARIGKTIKHGVYMAVTGPSYETPAEIKAFRNLGADAVGMSTVPEAILANAAGLRVAGLSCVTNKATGLSGTMNHQDVLSAASSALPAMKAVLASFWERMASNP